jgi:DNA-binding IclR family transcriptional regulator
MSGSSSPARGNLTVKSARRVFEILEYFDIVQRELSLTEIAKALDYPASSTSALLHSLVELGYLSTDYGGRTFRPTARVALLGSWISTPLFRDGGIHRMMEDLNQRTGETVILGIQTGIVARYIHVVQGFNPMRLYVKSGAIRPLASSGVGRLFLSRYEDDELRRIFLRLNSTRTEGEPAIDLRELLADIELIRERGYAVSFDRITPGAGVVAAMLPGGGDERPLAIGVGGHSSVIRSRHEEFAKHIRDTVNLHFSTLEGVSPPTEKMGRSNA